MTNANNVGSVLPHLSILDLAPVDRGGTVANTFAASVALAQRAEALGYRRIWYAEHHNVASIASSAPSVLIAHTGAHTSQIRLGAGGVMLPNHAPLVVAEQFGSLAAMYGDRIDLGVGRASGTDPATRRALGRDHTSVDTFTNDLEELRGYLSARPAVGGVSAVPGHRSGVPLYVLGSSVHGAALAASLGLPFAFASHFSPHALDEALTTYRSRFVPSDQLRRPYVMLSANVIAAETEAAARDSLLAARRMLATTLFGRQVGVTALDATDAQADELLARGASHQVDDLLTYTAAGPADKVTDYLKAFAQTTGADEIITVHQPQRADLRLTSVTVLGEAWQHALAA